LDQAKKLKELGVDTDSYVWWEFSSLTNEWKLDNKGNADAWCCGKGEYPAYTSAELDEIIMNYVETFQISVWRTESSRGMTVEWEYQDGETEGYDCQIMNGAQARAEFLIYLLENK
jgi:hypothetical protein